MKEVLLLVLCRWRSSSDRRSKFLSELRIISCATVFQTSVASAACFDTDFHLTVNIQARKIDDDASATMSWL